MSKLPAGQDTYLDRIGVGPTSLFGKAMVFTFFTALSQWFLKFFLRIFSKRKEMGGGYPENWLSDWFFSG